MSLTPRWQIPDLPRFSTGDWTCVEAGGANGVRPGRHNSSGFHRPGKFTPRIIDNIYRGGNDPIWFNRYRTNTVTVAMPAGVIEPTPGNNTAADIDGQDLYADLSVTKDDFVTDYISTQESTPPPSAPLRVNAQRKQRLMIRSTRH